MSRKNNTNGEKVRKILRSLPRSWDPKVTAMAKDLDALAFDNLLGSLMTHEILMKRNDLDEQNKNKNVAFKVENEDRDSQDSEDDKFALLARKFIKFMKNGRFNQRRNFKKDKDKKEANSSNEIQCFECKKVGYMRNECPQFRKKDHKEKKVKKKVLAI